MKGKKKKKKKSCFQQNFRNFSANIFGCDAFQNLPAKICLPKSAKICLPKSACPLLEAVKATTSFPGHFFLLITRHKVSARCEEKRGQRPFSFFSPSPIGQQNFFVVGQAVAVTFLLAVAVRGGGYKYTFSFFCLVSFRFFFLLFIASHPASSHTPTPLSSSSSVKSLTHLSPTLFQSLVQSFFPSLF